MLRVIITIAALLAASSGAIAQASEETATNPPPDYGQTNLDRSAEFSDEAVEQFAAAYSRIYRIQQDLSNRLQETADREVAMKMQRDVQKEMVDVVRAEGMSVEDYNEVVAAMQADVVLRNRILDEVNR